MHEEWLAWMKTTHIPAVMATGQFMSHTMSKIIEETYNQDGVTYAVQYIAKDIMTYENYQQNYAPQLQRETQQKYSGKYAAFRTCMEIVDEGNILIT